MLPVMFLVRPHRGIVRPKGEMMQCPYCNAKNQSRVVDTTRDAQGGIRRRRECKVCGRRFSTYERVLSATPLLVKSNGSREAFDREKLIRGIQISCAKRPISAAAINGLVDRIETHLQHLGKDEVSSRVVGDMVIEGLKEIDPIAYIRYAIVYLRLDSLAGVRDIIDGLLTDQNTNGKRATKAIAALSARPPSETTSSMTSSPPPKEPSTPLAASPPTTPPEADGAADDPGKTNAPSSA